MNFSKSIYRIALFVLSLMSLVLGIQTNSAMAVDGCGNMQNPGAKTRCKGMKNMSEQECEDKTSRELSEAEQEFEDNLAKASYKPSEAEMKDFQLVTQNVVPACKAQVDGIASGYAMELRKDAAYVEQTARIMKFHSDASPGVKRVSAKTAKAFYDGDQDSRPAMMREIDANAGLSAKGYIVEKGGARAAWGDLSTEAMTTVIRQMEADPKGKKKFNVVSVRETDGRSAGVVLVMMDVSIIKKIPGMMNLDQCRAHYRAESMKQENCYFANGKKKSDDCDRFEDEDTLGCALEQFAHHFHESSYGARELNIAVNPVLDKEEQVKGLDLESINTVLNQTPEQLKAAQQMPPRSFFQYTLASLKQMPSKCFEHDDSLPLVEFNWFNAKHVPDAAANVSESTAPKAPESAPKFESAPKADAPTVKALE